MQTEQATNSGHLHILKLRKALNKAFLKVKLNRSQIQGFKENLIQLLDRINDIESEKFQKNLVTINLVGGSQDLAPAATFIEPISVLIPI